jgi:hypothetical protein
VRGNLAVFGVAVLAVIVIAGMMYAGWIPTL